MRKTYIRVFLKKETAITSCLRLVEYLKASHLVEDAKFFSDIFSEPKRHKEKSLPPVQEALKRKFYETEKMLDCFEYRTAND